MHPVSPLVRGWLAVVAVAFVYGQNTLSSSFGGGEAYPGEEFVDGGSLLVPVLIGSGILLLILLGFLGSWWFTKYQVTDRHVNVNSGMVFRRQRQARIDRVQSIDIAQPLVARIFGLAELRFDVADSGSAAMSLAFIKLSEAHQLRNTILARAAGLKAAEAPQQYGHRARNRVNRCEHGAGADRGVHAPDSAAAQLQAASEYVVATVPVGRVGRCCCAPSRCSSCWVSPAWPTPCRRSTGSTPST